MWGTGSGVGAGLVWGLAFLVPEMVAAGAVELTLARYLAYGIVSAALLGWRWASLRGHLDASAWRAAGLFAVCGNAGYYLLVVLGIRLVGAAVTVTVIGTLPITVALVGNVRSREFPFRVLAVPAVLVAVGLALVNGTELAAGAARPGASVEAQLGGLLCAFGALALWTAYGVGNAAFLRQRPALSAGDWSTVVGVSTGLVSLVLVPLAMLDGFTAGTPGELLAAGLLLGVVVSWGGTLLWNRASIILPTAVLGLLVVVETVSGIGYVSAYTTQLPPPLQLLGIAVVIAGVMLGIRLPQRHAVSPTGEE